MDKYRADQIRNVVLLSHSGAGKTSISEAMLFNSKTISRLGKVDDGTTTSDYEPEEIKRRGSVNLSLLPFEWKGTKVNVLDTPGYADFVGEVMAALSVAEGAVIVISAASGVEVGATLVWKYASERDLPRVIFVNKIDRDNTDFYKTVDQLVARFGRKCVPIQLPVGAESKFQGVVDLIGADPAKVPPDLKEKVKTYGERLIEAAAETDDELVAKYLDGKELTLDEIRRGIRVGTAAGKLVPVLVGSALHNQGVSELMNAVCDYLPSPKDGKKVKAINTSTQKEEEVAPSPEAPLAALVFKTTADPYVGRLTYLRVFGGAIHSDSSAWNCARNKAERIGQLYMIRGKSEEATSSIGAGDIGAVAKLAETGTGDTLCNKEHSMKLDRVQFPAPVLSMALYPKTKVDTEKLGPALARLVEEDPTLSIHKNADTGEIVLSGMGDAHIETSVEKMRRKFGVEVKTEIPKIAYKETITVPTRSDYKHKKQTGGHGQYGHVVLKLEPMARGSGPEFAEAIVGGSVPKNYVPAVEKGVNEAIHEGVVAGYPLTDIKITLVDGSSHAVDSSEMAFKIATLHAIKKGVAEAQPALLEPIMDVKITVPENFTGDVMSDLNSKRAKVLGILPQDGSNTIDAEAPLAEIIRYATDLRSITQGLGNYTMKFSHYEEVPAHIAQKIIAESPRKKEVEA